MIRHECDRCGCTLAPDDAGRFIAKIEVYAAAGRVEFDHADVQRDHEREIKELVEHLRTADPDEIEDQIYRCLRFDLCAQCQRRFLEDPLGRK